MGDFLTYSVQTFQINSMLYGLPQNRTRIFIVGVKEGDGTSELSADESIRLVTQHLQQMNLELADPDACF